VSDVEAPVPDLLDLRGRLRRLAIASAVGLLVAVVVATLCYGAARDDIEHVRYWRTTAAAWRFVGFFTVLSFVVSATLVHWLLGRRRRRLDSFVPPATVTTRRDRPRS
jgi:hypothetical protein